MRSTLIQSDQAETLVKLAKTSASMDAQGRVLVAYTDGCKNIDFSRGSIRSIRDRCGLACGRKDRCG